MDNYSKVVDEFFALNDYCKDKENFDQIKFKGMLTAYTNNYKRLKLETNGVVVYDYQGHVAESIMNRNMI